MFIEILDRLKGERGPLLPKKKPEKEVKKRKLENFEKVKPALENPDEVKNRLGLKYGGTFKDYINRDDKYEDFTFEEWLREDKAEGGRIGFKVAGFVNQVPIDTGKVKPGYITGQELEELIGIPNLKNKAKELMYAPKESKRQKNIFGDFYRKDLKARYFNIGQGGKFGTLHYKKPTAKQIKQIKEYHLRTGAKYGLTDETIKGMKQFYNDPTLRKFIRKGEIVPEEVLKAKGININTAANITYRLAQHLNGKEFTNVNVDIPRDKTIGKKIFETIAKAPFGNVYQQKAYQNALNEISEQLGPNYFKGSKSNMDLMKREARRILNKEGVPTFDPTVKGSTGFNINEIIGVKTGARVKGMAPYSQFVNIMEGKLNAEQYGNFVRQFEKFSNRMQTENKSDVIKDYNKYTKKFLKNNPSVKATDIPKFSLQSPEKIYGKKRITDLAKDGLDLNKSFNEIGYTVDVGKKTRTLKEFITDPKNIARLKKFGSKGALVAGALAAPSVVQAADGTEAGSILPETVAAGTGAAAVGTKRGRQLIGTALKGAGKVLAPLAIPLEAGFMINEMQKGKSAAEVLATPFMLQTAVRGIQDVSRMTPVERQAKARELIESDESGLSSDFYTPDLQGIESVNLEEVQEKLNNLRELNRQARIASEAPELIDYYGEGLKEGGPADPSKRKFMKFLAGIASIPFIGKYLKLAEPAQKVGIMATEGAKLGVEKLMLLINKIKKLGTPDKTRQTQDLQEVTIYKGKDGSEYELVEDLATGDVRVTKDKPGIQLGGDKAYDVIEDRSSFTIKKGRADETTKGKKPPDEYDEMQEVPSRDGTFDDFDDVSDQTIKEIDDELDIKKGFYKGGLTDTIPPERGPMNQGVAQLYQRR